MDCIFPFVGAVFIFYRKNLRTKQGMTKMDELLMRVRVENGECMPQPTYVSDSMGFSSRDEFLQHCLSSDLVMSVQELQECLTARVFENDEDVIVRYEMDELIELLQSASIVFLWCNMPEALRQTFASRNVIPITRKMKPLEQALIVVRQLHSSQHKRSEWIQLLEKHLRLVSVQSVHRDLKTVVLRGTEEDMIQFINQEVTSIQNPLVSKENFTGYLFASYSSFFDAERARYWLELMHDAYDPDFRFLEQVVHSMQNITFFWNKASSRVQEKGDLLQHVRQLETDIQSIKEQHANEISELLQVIEMLSRDGHTVRNEDGQQSNPLNGRKIAVVGDDVRQVVYKMLLQREGALPVFIPGFSKISAGAERFSHVDGVIFVTAYSSHSLYYALKARRNLTNTVLVHQCGMSSFQNGIAELCAKFEQSPSQPLHGAGVSNSP